MTGVRGKVVPRLRRAGPADASLLAELGARTFSDTFLADNKPEDIAAHIAETYGDARQADELSDPRATFFLADVDDVAAGYAFLQAGVAPACVPQDRPIELSRLYVVKEWLGRGVGEALMRGCIEHARAAGHRTLWLGVWEHNTRAMAFYRRWELVDVGVKVFQVGSDPQNDVVMSLSL